MDDKSLFPALGIDSLPMNNSNSFEGALGRELNMGLFAFDIETFSPKGFPLQAEDPIVNFSLVSPLTEGGVFVLSAIVKPNFEQKLLLLLYKLLSNLGGACLLTYNGLRFDVRYVVQRGGLYGLNFEDVFANFRHVDVYRLLRWLNADFPRYDQKTVEHCLGIVRAIPQVSGGNYHLFYNDFVQSSNLTPMFYNIEDSFGCLRIADNIRSLLVRKNG
ncbi:MAG: ribonuclease H-like domain-containing protein [Candidatus Bathyarchaeales archaeon]